MVIFNKYFFLKKTLPTTLFFSSLYIYPNIEIFLYIFHTHFFFIKHLFSVKKILNYNNASLVYL